MAATRIGNGKSMSRSTVDKADPIERAKRYTNELVDLVIAAKAANENTKWVFYSPHLADQIPLSHAANAFNELQRTLLFYSVVRACALFDRSAKDRVSLHTVIDAFPNNRAVKEVARERKLSHVNQSEPRMWTDEDDEEILDMLRRHWKMDRERRGELAEKLTYKQVRIAKKIIVRAERKFIAKHLRPFRNHHIAHNLSSEARDGKTLKFVLGMEQRAIEHAKCAVDLLHQALNGVGFDWEGLEEIQTRNAKEFWSNLTFNLPDPPTGRQ